MGYYPAATEAIAELAKHLAPARPGSPIHVLDPCAGQGEAIRQIAESLGVTQDQIYCIELDNGRGDKIRELMPDAKLLSPCSFFGTAIMPASFSLVYCNPPFDHQLGGGGREESHFFRDCYRLLAKDGIAVFVAPFDTFKYSDELCIHLDTHYKDAAFFKFPDEHRPYHECCFIGVKRNVPIGREQAANTGLFMSHLRFGGYYGYGISNENRLTALGSPLIKHEKGGAIGVEEDIKVWGVPESRTPLKFAKSMYTDEELIEAVAGSRLNSLILGVEEPPMREPPLPLEKGHVAMLLAAGALDGLVEVEGGDNHVVRGIAEKIEVFNEEASDYTVSDDGETARIKEVYSQQITLKVRCLDRHGSIYTFTADATTVTGEDRVTEAEVSSKDWEQIQKLKRITVANGATPGEEMVAKVRLQAVMKRINQCRATG